MSSCAAPAAAVADQQQKPPAIEYFKYSRRVALKSLLGRPDGGLDLAGERVAVGGWVKAFKEKPKKEASAWSPALPVAHDATCTEVLMSRLPLLRCVARILARGCSPPPQSPPPMQQQQPEKPAPARTVSTVGYLRINDGSCVANLQVVVDSTLSMYSEVMSIGASILVEGVLRQLLENGKQVVKLKAEKILHIGKVDVDKYSLAKTGLSLDSIRSFPHLRPRATTVGSVARICSTAANATHNFFESIGVLHVHMPIITAIGFQHPSKMFQVTTLFHEPNYAEKSRIMGGKEDISLEDVKIAIKNKESRIEELGRSDSNREAFFAAFWDLQKASELALQLEKQQKTAAFDVIKADFTKDFFRGKAYLSVSATLHLESYASALSSVYAFGPVFSAKESPSTNNLAENWMVEVELAFAELEDTMNCAEDFLKFIVKSISEKCSDDMKFLSKRVDKDCIARLQSVVSSAFARTTYTQALEDLSKVQDKIFETNMEWGMNLTQEHIRYLAEEIYKGPVIVYEYPKEVKPFYVRSNGDGKTISAFDIIVPKVGILVRGSQKEERLDMITSRIQELGLPKEQYEWYVDLRRHGTVKHSGFSLGLEDLIMFVIGLEDIRDAIPFPRACGYING